MSFTYQHRYTVEHAAQALGVTKQTCRRWLRAIGFVKSGYAYGWDRKKDFEKMVQQLRRHGAGLPGGVLSSHDPLIGYAVRDRHGSVDLRNLDLSPLIAAINWLVATGHFVTIGEPPSRIREEFERRTLEVGACLVKVGCRPCPKPVDR